MTEPRSRRAPSDRDSRNTEAMLDAAVVGLAADGWGQFSIAATAKRMGTSIRPVHSRVASRGDLAARVWRDRIQPGLIASLTRLIDSVKERRLTDIASGLILMENAGEERDALAEALIVTRYEPALRAAVNRSLGKFVRAAITPGPRLDPSDAARSSYAIQLALGLVLASRYPRMREDLTPALAEVALALCAEAVPGMQPDRSAVHIDQWPDLAPGDPTLERVLRTTLLLVSQSGFESATVKQIAKSSGVSEGYVFGRYPRKRDLLLDALGRQNDAGWQLNADYLTSLADEAAPGLAAAVLMREILKPGRDLGRDMALELLRLSWHDEVLSAQAVESMDQLDPSHGSDTRYSVDAALDFGTYLLPRFAPEAWRLPLDVVTVPLDGLRSSRPEMEPSTT